MKKFGLFVLKGLSVVAVVFSLSLPYYLFNKNYGNENKNVGLELTAKNGNTIPPIIIRPV